MPNWCSNKATIKFKSAKAGDEFCEACVPYEGGEPVDGTLLDLTEPRNLFQHYCPMPANLGDDWYDWCVANWGTKWPPSIHNVLRVGDYHVELNFDTAWSPPIDFFAYCGEAYGWEWELQYIELGCDFAGDMAGDKDGIRYREEYRSGDEGFDVIAEAFGISTEDFGEDSGSTDGA